MSLSFRKRRLVVASSGRRCSWLRKWRHPLPAPYLLLYVTDRNLLMVCWWTGLRLGFSLLGALVLGAHCYAMPQGTQANVGADKGTDDSRSADREAGKPKTSGQPAVQWEDRENSVGLHLLKNIAEDQKALWIGPKNLHWVDADWLRPMGRPAPARFST